MNADTVAWTNKAASAAILVGPGAFYGAVLTATSDTATLTLYDSLTAGGTVICSLSAATLTSAPFTPGVRMPVSIGIYAALTGTTPSATVCYTP